MKSFCERLIDHFAEETQVSGAARRQWYLMTAKAGPNAVLKVMLGPAPGDDGFALTVARNADTEVVARETRLLENLAKTLPQHLGNTVPKVVAHGAFEGLPYFALPWYESHVRNRLLRRLTRNRRLRWVETWLADLARATRGVPLDRAWLEREFEPTVRLLQNVPTLDRKSRLRLRENWEQVKARAADIPGLCCHGDIWEGNLLWRRGARGAIVLDWGAARWPGLPAVDLCQFLFKNDPSPGHIADTLRRHCAAIGLDLALLPALYDLYFVFVKTELDHAYRFQPHKKLDPFATGLPSDKLHAIGISST